MIVRTIQAVSRLPLALPTGREELMRLLGGEFRANGGEIRTDEELDPGIGRYPLITCADLRTRRRHHEAV